MPEDLHLKYLALQKVYVQGLAERMQALAQAKSSQDLQTLGRLAHQLCGSAAAYGFEELSRLSRQLEYAVQAGDGQVMATAYSVLQAALQQVLDQHAA